MLHAGRVNEVNDLSVGLMRGKLLAIPLSVEVRSDFRPVERERVVEKKIQSRRETEALTMQTVNMLLCS